MDARMAVICGIFLGEKTGSISFKSKSLDRQISRSPASSFFGKSPGSFASVETAALIWNGFDEAKSLRMDEIVDLLSLKRIDLPRNYLGVKVLDGSFFFNQASPVPLERKECQCLPSHSTLTFAIPKRCFYGTLPQSSSKVSGAESSILPRPWWETPKFRGFRGTSKCRNEKFDEAYPLRINISHQKRKGKASTHKWRLFNRIFLSFPRRVWSFPLQGFHSKWCHKSPQRLDVIAATFFMEVCCLQWRW